MLNGLLMKSININILKNIIANYSTIISVIVAQLLTIYFFTNYKGIGFYGNWVLIYTIPGYLSIAEFGVSAIVGTRMMKSFLNKKRQIFYSQLFLSFTILTFNFVFLFLVYHLAICFGLDFNHLIKLNGVDVNFLISNLMLYVFLCWICTLFEHVFRSVDRFSTGVIATSVIRMLELVFPFYILKSHGVEEFVFLLLISRLILTLIFIFYVKITIDKMLFFNRLNCKLIYVRLLFLRGISFSTFPIGNAIVLQGTSFIVGVYCGPTILGVFNILRTISRLLVQSAAAINKAFWPHLTKSSVSGDYETFEKYKRISLKIIVLYCITVSFVVCVSSDMLFKLWLGKELVFDFYQLSLLLLLSTSTSLWQCLWVCLMSIDFTKKFGYYFFSICIISQFFSLMLMSNGLPINYMVISMVLFELLVFKVANTILNLEVKRRLYVK